MRRRGSVFAALAVLSAPLFAQDPRALLEEASKLKDRGDWKACLETLESVLERAAEDPASAALARCRRGECYLAMAKPSEAEEEFSKVSQDFPEETEAVLWAAVGLIAARHFQGKLDEALAAYREVERAFAEGRATPLQKAWASFQAGCVAISKGEPERALRLLGEVRHLPLQDRGPLAQADLKRAEVHIGRSEFLAAVPILREVLEEAASPEVRAWAGIRLAEALYQSGAYSASLEAAERVVAAGTSSEAKGELAARALAWKAKASLALGRFAEAGAALEAAAALEALEPKTAFETLLEAARVHGAWSDEEFARSSEGRKWRTLGEKAFERAFQALRLAEERGFGEAERDRARLEAATALERLGERERALAWLRAGIQDPARLAQTDREIAERIGRMLEPQAAREWYDYLLSPAARPDPTARYVLAEFAKAPSAPSASSVAERLPWLYAKAERERGARNFEEALRLYSEADSAARTAWEKALACDGLVQTYQALAIAAAEEAEQRGLLEAAKAAAERGVEHCLEVVLEGTASEAHRATEFAAGLYQSLGLREEAIRVLERIAEEVPLEADPSKHAFARFLLLRTYPTIWKPLPWLVDYGLKLWREIERSPQADVLEIAAATLSYTASYACHAGDKKTAEELRALLRARWPERFREERGCGGPLDAGPEGEGR